MVTIELSDGLDSETTPQLVKPPNFKPAQGPLDARPTPTGYYSRRKGATAVTKAVEDPYKPRNEDAETVSLRRNNTQASYQTSRLASASSSNRWGHPDPVHKQVAQLNSHSRIGPVINTSLSPGPPRLKKRLFRHYFGLSLPASSPPQDSAQHYSTIDTLTQERAEKLYRQRDQARQEILDQKRLNTELERQKNLEIRHLKGSLHEKEAEVKDLEAEVKDKDRKIKALEDEAKKRKSQDENVSTKKIKLSLELEVKVKGTQIEGIVVNEGI